mmetsp:Transcript_18168/g.26632  ORF Transcript_18168/g.26632 Transcript_18168/m.26632 type:complete len:122 (-) Transcript_18168:813-1178(-)
MSSDSSRKVPHATITGVVAFAAVVCHIHSRGGVFYRITREGPILCSEFAELSAVARALTRFLMAPPEHLCINIDTCHDDMWPVFKRFTLLSHGGSSLVVSEKKKERVRSIVSSQHGESAAG